MTIAKSRTLISQKTRRAITAIVVSVILWEIGSRSLSWLGVAIPGISAVPPPSAVVNAFLGVVVEKSYWYSWYLSTLRVLGGFLVAMLLGIPLGIMLAINRTFNGIVFPVFEVLRPIPPLAWVPLAIIFWPTQGLSIGFVTFLGAFFTIVINVLDGARSIDGRFYSAAQSMGASRWQVFRRVILPATIPSITVGAVVGMGITWEVVVAAEMISGSGSSMGRAGGGLGFFIWSSYLGGSYEQIIVGMISIGVAGYLCSSAVRMLSEASTPWLKRR